jgi:quercetin dioxygenase-like cupin family protein
MSYFQNLDQIAETLDIDPSTKDHPIKRIFVIDGEHLTANVGIVRDSGNALHTQEEHDEVLVIIDGDVNFQVGEEIKEVKRGDLVFIPRDTLHGPILEEGQSFAALSIFAPKFDRSKPDIVWDRDA